MICDKIQFKQALSSVCSSAYNRAEVTTVVRYLSCHMKTIIMKKWSHDIYQDNEAEDRALDFIAPLFKRNVNGEFVELIRYFKDKILMEPENIHRETIGLLSSVFRQESIRLYQFHDPAGKIFYRSLRHVLDKHCQWHKSNSVHGQIIKNGTNSTIIAEDIHFSSLTRHSNRWNSTSAFLEDALRQLVDQQDYCVPVSLLLNHFRVCFESPAAENYQIEDHTLTESLQIIFDRAINETDGRILQKYEADGKITAETRLAFKNALKHIISDWYSGNKDRVYFDYLSAELPVIKTKEDYLCNYRTRFEYVVKFTKNNFSSEVKNGII